MKRRGPETLWESLVHHDESVVAIETGTPQLLLRREGRVAVMTLNRPASMNALSGELTPAIRRSIQRCADDPEIGALLITGAGKAFCAGGDVKGMGDRFEGAQQSEAEHIADLQRKQRTLTGALFRLNKPTVAALPGAAVGAGLALALACDIRILAASAFMATGYARLAMSGDYGVNWFLTRLAGPGAARDMMLTARRIEAVECKAFGLASQIVPDGELQATSLRTADTLASVSGAAVRSIKQNLNDALHLDLESMMDKEADRLIRLLHSDEHRQAAEAFRNKSKDRS